MSDVLVLCYHAVSERWPADLSVSPQNLRAQLALLQRKGYRATTFHEAVTGAQAGKTLAVTFDDAFHSVLERAYPILSELGMPATVFAPTAFMEQTPALTWPGIEHWAAGPHAPELAAMSWAELRLLAEAGWEVGSHTCSHPRLTTLDDATLAAELGESRSACAEAMGAPCRSIAYPYGDVDARVVGATRIAGYETGGTLPGRPHPGTALAWPRMGVYHGDDMRRFSLKTARLTREVRGAVDRIANREALDPSG